jgi:hypothetical protein
MSQAPESISRRSANIFVSYRRGDSAGHAGRLFDHLKDRFPGRVFMDLDTIKPGVDFVEVIEQAVGCCEVLIVMIGRDWLEAQDADGRRRLDDANDFVRLEIATALNRDVRVIPVLVQGAVMPRREDLPPDLVKLARRNAVEVSDARFVFDMDRLIQAIEEVLIERAPSLVLQAAPPPSHAGMSRRQARWALAALVLLALGGGLGWWQLGLGKVLPAPVSQPGAPQTLVSPAVGPGALETTVPAGKSVVAAPARPRPTTLRPSKPAPSPQKETSRARGWWNSAKKRAGSVVDKVATKLAKD